MYLCVWVWCAVLCVYSMYIMCSCVCGMLVKYECLFGSPGEWVKACRKAMLPIVRREMLTSLEEY